MRMNRHHLLEIILWPNGDGTVSKILNSRKRLRELGIYDDWKLTIAIPASEHSRMHSHNRPDDTKQKMSAARSGEKHHMYGKKHSEEAKAKMSAAKKGEKHHMYGKQLSEETKSKMSEAKKGEKHPMYGKQLTSEHRANLSAAISAAHKGRHWYNNGVVNKFAKECQPGFTRGRIYKRKKSS